jgi:hypothetical protein
MNLPTMKAQTAGQVSVRIQSTPRAQSHHGDYRWANDADETLRFILTRGSVVVGSKWYPGMSEPLNGVMRLTGNPGSTGHAYLLFGFSPDQDAFLMANSWGPSWGINGCAFLPYDALDQLMQQDGVVCSAIED